MTRKSKRELERALADLDPAGRGDDRDLKQAIPFGLVREWEELQGRDPTAREDLLKYDPKE